MRAKFGLPSIEAEESVIEKRPPIRVKFEIPYFTVSGIQVDFLLLPSKFMSIAYHVEHLWVLHKTRSCQNFSLPTS